MSTPAESTAVPAVIDQAEDAVRARAGSVWDGASAMRGEIKRRVAELETWRDAIERGEVDSADLPHLHQLLNDSFGFAAIAAAEKPTLDAQVRAFATELPAEARKIRRDYIEAIRYDPDASQLEAVEVNGSIEQGARLGYFRSLLQDGSYGYLQRRNDDCLRAAIATVVQAPMTEVPDLRPDQLAAAGKDPEEIERVAVATLGEWLERQGLTITTHEARLPVRSRRWIGLYGFGSFDSDMTHCLVMHGREPIFDTGLLLPPRKDDAVSPHGLDDIEYGLVIERR